MRVRNSTTLRRNDIRESFTDGQEVFTEGLRGELDHGVRAGRQNDFLA